MHDVHFGIGGAGVRKATTRLVVNGGNVTACGLFVELPYDLPNQAAWMNGTTQGYAAYKVADSVTSHRANGLGGTATS